VRPALIAAAALLLAATAAAPDGQAQRRCNRPFPRVAVEVPAAVVVTTGCGRFRIDGAAVGRVGPMTRPVPRNVVAYWMDFTWYRASQGHIEIGRGHRFLWRSHRGYAARYATSIGMVTAGAGHVAFSYIRGRHSTLYVARLGGAEHVVGADENPIVFLPSGQLVTWRYDGAALMVRREDGRVTRVLAAHAAVPQVDPRSGAIVFRTRGRVSVFAHGRVRRIAELENLGIAAGPTMDPLGQAVAIHDNRRLAVVGYDGRLIASTRLPPRRLRADMVSSAIVANAAGTAFAFTAIRNDTAKARRGRETVYVLRAGEHSVRAVHAERLQFEGCGRMTELAWHGPWLLYSSQERHVVLVDTSRHAAPVELTRLIAALPGVSPNGYFDTGWSL
jgi:hypothetical protein